MRSSLGSGAEVPCVQCERRERGLAWGELCTVCRRERERRARRVARYVSGAAGLLTAIWVAFRVPAQLTQRIYAGIAVLAVYALVRKIVFRVAVEFLPREQKSRAAGDS